MLKTTLAVAISMIFTSLTVEASIITTADGAGSDVAMRRNNASESAVFLRIKNENGSETSNLDRMGVLNFDTSLEADPITNAAVVITTDLDGDNQFLIGETLYLYGIPDGGTDENYTSNSFSDFEYTTGTNGTTDPRPLTDLTGNNVNDDTALLLASITMTSPTVAGVPIIFQSPSLTTFVAGDTTGIASFILTVSSSEVLNTAVIASAENTNQAAPTLLTNADAPAVAVPEPSSLVLLVGICLAASNSRRFGAAK